MGRAASWAWGALGLGLLAAGWTWGHAAWGPFVLPSLQETGAALLRLVAGGQAARALGVTLVHALGGAAIGAAAGFALGVAAGLVPPLRAMLRPVVTALLGVPPVAWVVMTFLWFGPGMAGPVFTVTVAILPLVFAATLAGMLARDPALAEMAAAFRVPRGRRFLRVTLPGLVVPVAPALSTGFAMSWKVALTAEVLGDGSGMGGAFAVARAHLDLAEAMAWIALVLAVLLLTEGVLLAPLRRRAAP